MPAARSKPDILTLPRYLPDAAAGDAATLSEGCSFSLIDANISS